MMKLLTVGQLARKTHIHVETVRYHEKSGLMPIPRKNSSGYRQYSEQKEGTMPTDACLFFYSCTNCHALLKPKQGDCCIFCSYGSVPVR